MKKEKEEGEHVRLQVRKITEIRHILSTVYQQTFFGGDWLELLRLQA